MPTTTDGLVLHHAPNTRSTGVRVLLEELNAPHELHVINLKAGEQQGSAHLAVNPMGKVPAIRHGGATVAEQAACYLYLADLFPEAGLAPGTTDPARDSAVCGSLSPWPVSTHAIRSAPSAPCLSRPVAVSLKRFLTPLLVLSLGILALLG